MERKKTLKSTLDRRGLILCPASMICVLEAILKANNLADIRNLKGYSVHSPLGRLLVTNSQYTFQKTYSDVFRYEIKLIEDWNPMAWFVGYVSKLFKKKGPLVLSWRSYFKFLFS